MKRSLEAGMLLVVLLLASGCLGPRLARCPEQGGATWRELESEHFKLQTDLPLEQARAGVAYLEKTRAALIAAALAGSEVSGAAKVTVYVFAEDDDFKNLFPRLVDGLFFIDDNQPAMVLHGRPETWDQRFSGLSDISNSTVKHELTHYLSAYVFPRQPRWLAEGVAQYLETLHLSEDGKSVIMGRPNLRGVQAMKIILDEIRRGIEEDFSVSQVFAWDKHSLEYRDREVIGLYAGSWLLVHWLYNNRQREFAVFQRHLAAGKPPDDAMDLALPWLRRMPLDKVLLEYAQHGSYQEFTFPLSPVQLSAAERDLPDPEVHALRARLAVAAASMAKEGRKERLQLAEQEVLEALRLDPGNVWALRLKARTVPAADRPALARVAIEKHPDDGEAWLLLADMLYASGSKWGETEKAYLSAVELGPNNAQGLNGLAWLYVGQRRFDKALPYAERAVRLAPWSHEILDTYASALAGTGRCNEAASIEQRAIDLASGEHGDTESLQEYRQRLQSIRGTCRATAHR